MTLFTIMIEGMLATISRKAEMIGMLGIMGNMARMTEVTGSKRRNCWIRRIEIIEMTGICMNDRKNVGNDKNKSSQFQK